MSFARTGSAGRPVSFDFDGETISAHEGDTIAAALLAAGVDRVRTTGKQAQPRLPYCLMGVCFDCLVEVDGDANQQSCMIEVRQGMQVRRQYFAHEVPA